MPDKHLHLPDGVTPLIKLALLTLGVVVALALIAAVLNRGRQPGGCVMPYLLRPSLLAEADLSFS